MEMHESKMDLSGPIDCPICKHHLESKLDLNAHIHMAHDTKKGACIICS